MPDSQLVHTIALDSTLRLRIEAIIRGRLASVTATERAVLTQLPLDALAWAVASNPTIFAAIKAALSGDAVTAAIDAGLSDDDLTFVVVSELTFLA